MTLNNHPVEIGPLAPSDQTALPGFIRETWTAAFGGDMHPADLPAHLAMTLSDTEIHNFISTDRFLVARSGGRRQAKQIPFTVDSRVLGYDALLALYPHHSAE